MTRLLTALLVGGLMLFGCKGQADNGQEQAAPEENAVEIQAPGVNVEVDEEGVDVEAPATNVTVEEGSVDVEAPAADVEVQQ